MEHRGIRKKIQYIILYKYSIFTDNYDSCEIGYTVLKWTMECAMEKEMKCMKCMKVTSAKLRGDTCNH